MNQYVSVLKLDGVPILPPLMTAEVRNEARYYKNLAITLEQKRKSQCQINITASSSDEEVFDDPETKFDDSSGGESESEYLKISSIAQRAHGGGEITYRASATSLKMLTQNILENCEPTKSFTPPPNLNLVNIQNLSIFSKQIGSTPVAEAIIDSKGPVSSNGTSTKCTSSTASSYNSCLLDEISPIKADNNSTSLQNLAIPKTPPNSDAKLVRSNSYTLLTPSPLLIQHLASQGVSLNRTSASMEDISKKSASLKKSSSATKKARATAGPKKLPLKKFISPYDTKPASAVKKITSRAKSATPTILLRSNSTASSTQSKSSPKSHLDMENIKTMITQMEIDQKRQLSDLLKVQQQQQQQLEARFNQQKTIVMQKFRHAFNLKSESAGKHHHSLKHTKSEDTIRVGNSPAQISLVDNRREHVTTPHIVEMKGATGCCRKLFVRPKSAAAKQTTLKPDVQFALKTRSVTKINARVRGYLCRRLFATDNIQYYVQIIQDSLLLILNIQNESPGLDNDPVTKCLKTRTFHQLRKAMYDLNHLLFDTTIKQRMKMIAKDRELKNQYA